MGGGGNDEIEKKLGEFRMSFCLAVGGLEGERCGVASLAHGPGG